LKREGAAGVVMVRIRDHEFEYQLQ
jgi:hypothetical protein